jgi:lincosamide nucleotidyltransferase A/C/D/E
MRAEDVLAALDRLAPVGIVVWLDGGWGVDALLEELTRAHSDLDLVIAYADVAPACEALAPLGYAIAEHALPVRMVLRDGAGRQIDFHPVTFDAEGGGVQQLPGGASFRYPAEGFQGAGRVGGRTVRCLTPEVQALCHQGYKPDEDDRHDMRLLAERFDIAMPPNF